MHGSLLHHACSDVALESSSSTWSGVAFGTFGGSLHEIDGEEFAGLPTPFATDNDGVLSPGQWTVVVQTVVPWRAMCICRRWGIVGCGGPWPAYPFFARLLVSL